jgi:hypothetical protein
MSRTLLQRVKTHIVDTGTLLSGYSVRYFKWQDTDLSGAGEIALFRTMGTEGQVNRHVQFPDVSLYLLASPANVGQADDDLLGVVQYLRANPSGTGAFNMFPAGTFTGPTYLENGRAIFELVIRTGTTDH